MVPSDILVEVHSRSPLPSLTPLGSRAFESVHSRARQPSQTQSLQGLQEPQVIQHPEPGRTTPMVPSDVLVEVHSRSPLPSLTPLGSRAFESVHSKARQPSQTQSLQGLQEPQVIQHPEPGRTTPMVPSDVLVEVHSRSPLPSLTPLGSRAFESVHSRARQPSQTQSLQGLQEPQVIQHPEPGRTTPMVPSDVLVEVHSRSPLPPWSFWRPSMPPVPSVAFQKPTQPCVKVDCAARHLSQPLEPRTVVVQEPTRVENVFIEIPRMSAVPCMPPLLVVSQDQQTAKPESADKEQQTEKQQTEKPEKPESADKEQQTEKQQTEKPESADQGQQAKPESADQGHQAKPESADQGQQTEKKPESADQGQQAKPESADQGHQAKPESADQGQQTEKKPESADQGQQAKPESADKDQQTEKQQTEKPEKPETADKEQQTEKQQTEKPESADQGQQAKPESANQGQQAKPESADQGHQAKPESADQGQQTEKKPESADQGTQTENTKLKVNKPEEDAEGRVLHVEGLVTLYVRSVRIQPYRHAAHLACLKHARACVLKFQPYIQDML